jgi:hypothetical protein
MLMRKPMTQPGKQLARVQRATAQRPGKRLGRTRQTTLLLMRNQLVKMMNPLKKRRPMIPQVKHSVENQLTKEGK